MTVIKEALKNLCLSNGWSYGVFWRFDHRNSMLLTVEDVYYEEYDRSVTDDLLLQVHMLGDGIIGQSAIDGNHRWLFSDSSPGDFRIREDNSDFSCEFSSGIKTIAVIPLESCGVLQFGSTLKILENPGFVDRTRQIFREMGIFDGFVLSGNATSSLIADNIDQSGQFVHLIPSYNSLPSTHLQAFEFDKQGNFSGFNPLSLHGGSVDNQCLDPLFHEPNNLQGFDEFNSTEFPTPYGDDVLRWLYSEPTLNDDILQALVADLPYQRLDLPYQTHFGSVKREQNVEDSSTMVPKKGLFSELGLDQLLSNRADSSSFAKSSVEDPILPRKKRRVECFPESGNQTNLMMKPHVGLWAEQCFTADVKSCVTGQTKGSEESSKAAKKRARPGESTKPRPKDRQMIQDRIKELRDIIPNGAKCSIDALLDRTIRHMIFMQGVTKYVDKLKRANEAKARRNNSNNGGMSSSVAWAFEVGGQNPIVVEDLGHSGLMLIEMVCEEQGFFLEIADVIRGFGLTILKGVMEARDGKLLAHFIVEANRQVTRVEVLMSLLQLLKDSSATGLKSVGNGNRVLGNKASSLLNNYHHQPIMSLPIGLADALR